MPAAGTWPGLAGLQRGPAPLSRAVRTQSAVVDAGRPTSRVLQDVDFRPFRHRGRPSLAKCCKHRRRSVLLGVVGFARFVRRSRKYRFRFDNRFSVIDTHTDSDWQRWQKHTSSTLSVADSKMKRRIQRRRQVSIDLLNYYRVVIETGYGRRRALPKLLW